MKQIIKLFTLAGCLLLLESCTKTLDAPPVSSITNANYWKAEGDVSGYLTGVYSDLRNLMNTTYYFEDRSDAFVVGLEAGVSNAFNQNLTSSTAPSWLDFYNLVHHTNLILKHAPGISFASDANKNRILAETYFIRAQVYYLLLRSWGKVPIVLQPTESDARELPSRAGESEVMAQILSDIDQALALFPEAGFVNKYRASKPAAYALKADALLWKARVLQGGEPDLQGVLAAVDAASAGVSLEANFADIFATDKKAGREVIFALFFKKDEKSDHYSSRLKPRDIFVNSATNKESLAYAKNGARSVYAPSPRLEAVYNVNAADKRKGASIIKGLGANNTVIGVFDNKLAGTKYADDRYFDNDIIVYRLAELILFRAEALAALGRLPEAVAELDKVRERAGTGKYSGSMDKRNVELAILDERFRELYLELKRWPDLVRFHHGGTINIYSEVPGLNSSLPLFFPIPKTQMDLNPNLEQTKGY
jgi:hypothetical protein